MSVPAATFSDALVNARLKRSGPPKSPDSISPFRIYKHDLTPLKMHLTYVRFMQLSPEHQSMPQDEIVHRLIEQSKESDGPSVFLTDSMLPSVFAKELQKQSIAVFDARDIGDFVEARDVAVRYRILGSALAKTLGYADLSPYRYGGPVSGPSFFGREKVLGHVLSGKNIRNTTIVGNRRIGKTSCLLELRDRMKEIYDKRIRIAQLYGSKCKSTWDAVYTIFDEVGLRVPTGWSKFGAISPRYVLKMPQLLHTFAKSNDLHIVIFIDEYDDFLARDASREYEFTHLLRETVMDKTSNCFLVIAGFRYLMRERTLHASPLFNIAPGLELGALTQQESMEMITEPLLRMGIDISSDLQGAIYRETRGQPELIQMYCSSVIETFGEKDRLPTPAELLQKVNGSHEFRRTILLSFFFNTTATEQIVCLELMKKATLTQQDPRRYEFRRTDIEQILANDGYCRSNALIEMLVSNLTAGSFLEEDPPGVIRFATPQLVRFCQAQNIEALLARARDERGSDIPTLDELFRESPLPRATPELRI